MAANQETTFTGANFTGAIQQKCLRGQDFFITGPCWALVQDGHGDLGDLAAHSSGVKIASDIEAAIRENRLDEFVSNLANYGVAVHDWLREQFRRQSMVFVDANGVPKLRPSFKPVSGGTTSTMVFHLPADDEKKQQEKIVFAWVGDSTGKIFLEDEQGAITTLDGTDDHSPDNKQEYERLKAREESGQETGMLRYTTKGAHQDSQYLPIFDADGNKIDYFSKYIPVERTTRAYHEANAKVQADPRNEELKAELAAALTAYQEANKEYLASDQHKDHAKLNKCCVKEDGYGAYLFGRSNTPYGKDVQIAMTRSFGDFAGHQVGMIPVMETKEFLVKDLPQAFCRVIFVASDGVHDCYTDDELAKLVLSAKTDEQLLAEFVKQSRTLFGKQADDISFIRKFF